MSTILKVKSVIKRITKTIKMLVYIVKQHTGYEVAIVTVGCFCTEYTIVTAGSEVIWSR